MRIALVGHGLMGHEIEDLVASQPDAEIATIQCRTASDMLDPAALAGADVAIDFTAGELVPRHIDAYISAGVNAVIGTTNWDSHDPRLRAQVDGSGIGVIVGENFSPGAQIFIRLVAEASRMLSSLGSYDVFGFEIHHAHKLRSPSGTAEALARAITDNFPAKTSVDFNQADGQADPSVLRFSSVRGGSNPGLHEVIFDSGADEIRMTHAAHSRRAFAAGALMAARFIESKRGYFFFEDLFTP